MSRDKILEQLNEIFIDVFDDENIRIHDNTTSANIEGWDSLVHIHLIIEIESKFEIKFSIDEVSSMKNVGMMMDIIQNKIS